MNYKHMKNVQKNGARSAALLESVYFPHLNVKRR